MKTHRMKRQQDHPPKAAGGRRQVAPAPFFVSTSLSSPSSSMHWWRVVALVTFLVFHPDLWWIQPIHAQDADGGFGGSVYCNVCGTTTTRDENGRRQKKNNTMLNPDGMVEVTPLLRNNCSTWQELAETPGAMDERFCLYELPAYTMEPCQCATPDGSILLADLASNVPAAAAATTTTLAPSPSSTLSYFRETLVPSSSGSSSAMPTSTILPSSHPSVQQEPTPHPSPPTASPSHQQQAQPDRLQYSPEWFEEEDGSNNNGDHKKDVLPAYYAFVMAAGVVLVSLVMMHFAARDHGYESMIPYLKVMFRMPGHVANEKVGTSSWDIFTFSFFASAGHLILLGGLQLSFFPTLTTIVLVACTPGTRRLLSHSWSCCAAGRRRRLQRRERRQQQQFEKRGISSSSSLSASSSSSFAIQRPKREMYLTSRNIYQDFSQPFARTVILGLGQVVLLSMFIWSVFDEGRPAFDENRPYSFYFIGFILVICYVQGHDFFQQRRNDTDFWENVFYIVHSKSISSSKSDRSLGYWQAQNRVRRDGQPETYHVTPGEADFRYMLDTVVNSIGLGCLLVGVPIQLSRLDSPLEFVLNTIAAFFIIELDDSDELELTYHEQQQQPELEEDINLSDGEKSHQSKTFEDTPEMS